MRAVRTHRESGPRVFTNSRLTAGIESIEPVIIQRDTMQSNTAVAVTGEARRPPGEATAGERETSLPPAPSSHIISNRVNEVVVEPSTVTLPSTECEVAKLNYIDVGISGHCQGVFTHVSALEDGGAEIAVAKASVIAQLADVETLGTIRIRGVIGGSVECMLVRIVVCLWDAREWKHSFSIPCAVAEEANDVLLLPAGVTERLRQFSSVNNVDRDNDNDDYDDYDDSDANDCIDVNVVTRSGRNTNATVTSNTKVQQTDNDNAVNDTDSNNDGTDNHVTDDNIVCADNACGLTYDVQQSIATRDVLVKEQHEDLSLRGCWNLAKQCKGNFIIVDGLLMHQDTVVGQDVRQLVVPQSRQAQVLELGHGIAGAHMGWRNTARRIKYSFWWPSVRRDCMKYVSECHICQHKARMSCWDRVPIKPIPRADVPFSHWFMDVGGPLSSEKW